MEKWEGNHRIIVRIVSFCVMFRKCVSDKWEESRVDDLGERVIVDEATGEDGRVRRDWTS